MTIPSPKPEEGKGGKVVRSIINSGLRGKKEKQQKKKGARNSPYSREGKGTSVPVGGTTSSKRKKMSQLP